MASRLTSGVVAAGLAALAAACAATTVEEAAPVLADQSDRALIAEAREAALAPGALGIGIDWANPSNGHRGTVTATLAYVADDGSKCREVVETTSVGGETAFDFETACRPDGGAWTRLGEAQGLARLRREPSFLPDWRWRGLWVHDPWIGYGRRVFPFGRRPDLFALGPVPYGLRWYR